MNIFSRQISVYDGVTDNVGRVITLHDFLFSKEYANVIQMMRCIADKEERDKWKRRHSPSPSWRKLHGIGIQFRCKKHKFSL